MVSKLTKQDLIACLPEKVREEYLKRYGKVKVG